MNTCTELLGFHEDGQISEHMYRIMGIPGGWADKWTHEQNDGDARRMQRLVDT